MHLSREQWVEKLHKIASKRFRIPFVHALRLKGLMLKIQALDVK